MWPKKSSFLPFGKLRMNVVEYPHKFEIEPRVGKFVNKCVEIFSPQSHRSTPMVRVEPVRIAVTDGPILPENLSSQRRTLNPPIKMAAN
jgi:hypothetical protein